jgi:hypothetical protein
VAAKIIEDPLTGNACLSANTDSRRRSDVLFADRPAYPECDLRGDTLVRFRQEYGGAGEWLLSSYLATGMASVPIFIKADNVEERWRSI